LCGVAAANWRARAGGATAGWRHTMNRFLVSALLVLVACSGNESAASHAGTLTLTLTSGGSSDGALVMIVSGGPVTSVSAPGSYQVASNADGEGTHIMVVGNIAPGVV